MKAVHDGRHSADDDQEGRPPIAPSAAADEPDMVFRVSLRGVEHPTGTLEEFYREELRDLLQVVRLSFKGKPVLIDAFAFLNQPEREIPILREEDHGAK